MAYISDDYICTNKDCSKYNKRVEHIGKREERDTYLCTGLVECPPPPDAPESDRLTIWMDGCHQSLKRVPSAIGTHVSWSLWRV